jgi:ferrous iron transport protein A
MMELSLAMLHDGAKGKITQVRGGKGLVRRLTAMGFTYGTEVLVVCSHSSSNPDHGGPLVVEVKDSRIALGRGVAMKIMVQEVDN